MRPQSDAPSTDRSESTRTEALSANAPSGAPLPPQLLDQIFRQELLDQGPALYVATLEGRVIWANAGYRRLSEAGSGTLLPTEEIAAEIALLGSMVFREDVLTSANARSGCARQCARGPTADDAIAGNVQVAGGDSALETMPPARPHRRHDAPRLRSHGSRCPVHTTATPRGDGDAGFTRAADRPQLLARSWTAG
jgi:hypothetical protein